MSAAGFERANGLVTTYNLGAITGPLLKGEIVPLALDGAISLGDTSKETILDFGASLESALAPAESLVGEVVESRAKAAKVTVRRTEDNWAPGKRIAMPTYRVARRILGSQLIPAETVTGTLSEFTCELIGNKEVPDKTRHQLHFKDGEALMDTALTFLVGARLKGFGRVACAVGVDMCKVNQHPSKGIAMTYRYRRRSAQLPPEMAAQMDATRGERAIQVLLADTEG